MDVFVAAHGWHPEEAEEMITALESAGHHITFDWTLVRNALDTDREFAEQHALACLDGVWQAGVLVVMVRDGMVSALVELGIALARLIPVVALGNREWDWHGNTYLSLPTVAWCSSVAEAVATVSDLTSRFDRP